MGDFLEGVYFFISGLISFVIFVASWIYCINEYGYLFGVGLGWLPSIIIAVLVFYLWLPALILLFVLVVSSTK